MLGKRQTWSMDIRHSVKKWGESIGRDGTIGYDGSLPSPNPQHSDLLEFLTRNLYGFCLHIIAHAELIDGDELVATFQPGPRFDGQVHLPSPSRPGQYDRAFTGAGLQATLVDFN
jgi:hypothetical protein